jgi:hypothetical protein
MKLTLSAGAAFADALSHSAPAQNAARVIAPCPHCARSFRDQNACWQHIRAKHGRKAASAYRREHMPVEEHEKSVGEELAEAIVAAQCGEPIPDHIALMFPDEIRRARRQFLRAVR